MLSEHLTLALSFHYPFSTIYGWPRYVTSVAAWYDRQLTKLRLRLSWSAWRQSSCMLIGRRLWLHHRTRAGTLILILHEYWSSMVVAINQHQLINSMWWSLSRKPLPSVSTSCHLRRSAILIVCNSTNHIQEMLYPVGLATVRPDKVLVCLWSSLNDTVSPLPPTTLAELHIGRTGRL